MILPGWTCTCGVFNGEGKEQQLKCRACDGIRPGILSWQEARDLALKVFHHGSLPENFMRDAAVRLAQLVENGTRTHKEFNDE